MNGQLFFSSKQKIKRCSVLLGILLCSGGCSFFQNNPVETEQTAAKPGLITQNRIRMRKQKNIFLCLIAEQEKPFSFYDEPLGSWQGAEPEMIRQIAAKLKMEVVFVPVPASALAAALRNGRGDIAAGKLTTKQIASLRQTAVFPYADAKNGKFSFMVRSDDSAWKNALEKAASGIDGAAILKRNAQDLAPVSVELEEKENSEKAISISVDLQAKPAGKGPAGK